MNLLSKMYLAVRLVSVRLRTKYLDRSLRVGLPVSTPFADGVTGVLLVLFLGLAPSTQLMAQVPTYTGAEIPSTFVPTAVNASGQVAGYIYVDGVGGAAGALHAARYSGGVVTDLGVLPGGSASEATGINATGDVVGSATTANGVTHAFLYSGGVMKDLGTLPGGATSYATAINDAGQITGWSDTLQPNTSYPFPEHAFLYSGGVMRDLGNISGSGQFVNFSRGYAINASGQVVGWSIDDNFATHAFLYSGGRMSDLGTLGGSESRARGISDSGTVVGWSFTSGDAATHAFQVKAGAGMTDLGTLTGNTASNAAAINKDGQIVGSSAFSGTPAFIYTDATGMVKLDTHVSGAGWNLSGASAISSAGHIVASGANDTVFAANFLLTSPIAATISVNLVKGWNLIGNGNDAPLTVASTFGNAANVSTVWKWVASKTRWAFYTPSLVGQALTDYATGKGYDVLTTINGGEGFWVNTTTAFAAQLPAGTAIASASFQSMAPGWNLIATGDSKTPSQFNALVGAVTPITTLWSWDAAQTKWYFYSPALEAQGSTVLADYIAAKGYLGFGAKILEPSTGFWVNRP